MTRKEMSGPARCGFDMEKLIVAPKEYSQVTPVYLIRGPFRIRAIEFDVRAGKQWAYILTFDPSSRYSCGGTKINRRSWVLPTLCPPGKYTRALASFTMPPTRGPVGFAFGDAVALAEGYSFSIFAWGEDLSFRKIEAVGA